MLPIRCAVSLFTFHLSVYFLPLACADNTLTTFLCLLHLGSFHSQLAFVHTVLDKFDPARWLLLHLQPQFRFKSQYSTSFSTMFIMHTFSYTGLWRYFLLPSFPTLNLRHYPAPEFGTNPMAYCRNIRLLPMHSLTLHIFLHRILMKRKPSWMTCCNTIFRSPTNMLVHHHPMLFQILRSFRQRHPHLRSVNRRPKLLPRPLPSAAALNANRHHVPRVLRLPGHRKKNKNSEL